MKEETRAAEGSQYLTFCIGGEEYAIGILNVREVIGYDVVTRVPGVPPCIRGVINLRGSVLPVVDLAVKLGLGPSEITKRTCIVITEVHSRHGGNPVVIGVMVDAVSQVVNLTAADIQPAPDFGTRVRLELLLGMTRMGKKFAMLLDADRLLATEELLAAAGTGRRDPASAEPKAAQEGAA